MKKVFCILTLLAEVLLVTALADQLKTTRGSLEQSSFSEKSKTKEQVVYNLCLPRKPDFVYATVKPSNQSLPHKFNVAILEIKAYSFVFELERVDQAAGWDAMITVDWFFYTGIAFAHRERVYWLPELSGINTMTKKQSAVYCSNRSAELADIADRETYGLIYGHVAKHYKYQTLVYTYVHVWIASKYNSQTGNVAQSNGEPGFNGDGNWKQPGFPTSQSTSTELVMRVRYLHTNDSGLLNYPIGKEFEASTVLCSIKLSSDL